MKVYCVFSTDLNNDCEETEILQKIFSTRQKADEYLRKILERHRQKYLNEAQDLEKKLDDPNEHRFRYYQGREAVEQNIKFLREKAKSMKVDCLDYVIKEYEVE